MALPLMRAEEGCAWGAEHLQAIVYIVDFGKPAEWVLLSICRVVCDILCDTAASDQAIACSDADHLERAFRGLRHTHRGNATSVHEAARNVLDDLATFTRSMAAWDDQVPMRGTLAVNRAQLWPAISATTLGASLRPQLIPLLGTATEEIIGRLVVAVPLTVRGLFCCGVPHSCLEVRAGAYTSCARQLLAMVARHDPCVLELLDAVGRTRCPSTSVDNPSMLRVTPVSTSTTDAADAATTSLMPPPPSRSARQGPELMQLGFKKYTHQLGRPQGLTPPNQYITTTTTVSIPTTCISEAVTTKCSHNCHVANRPAALVQALQVPWQRRDPQAVELDPGRATCKCALTAVVRVCGSGAKPPNRGRRYLTCQQTSQKLVDGSWKRTSGCDFFQFL